MIYVADGPSDVPVFLILNQYGGRTLGVYNPNEEKHYRNVKALRDDGRVDHFASANYEDGSEASRWILESVREISEKIVETLEALIHLQVRPPGGQS